MQIFDEFRDELESLYEDKMFPFYLLVGGILVSAFTQDLLWLGIGVIGFLVFTFKGLVTE